MNEETQVNYTVKELLARIEGKIDTMSVQLGEKAAKWEVTQLQHEIEILKLGAAASATRSEVQAATDVVKRFWIGLCATAVVSVAGILFTAFRI